MVPGPFHFGKLESLGRHPLAEDSSRTTLGQPPDKGPCVPATEAPQTARPSPNLPKNREVRPPVY